MDKNIYIIGAGTYGAAIGELAESCGFSIVGFFDDDLSKVGNLVLGKPVIGSLDCKRDIINGANYVVAIGNNAVRVRKSKEIIDGGGQMPSLIHPKAEISSYSTIGSACIIHAFSYIWTEVAVGSFSIISPKVVIAHHTKIGEGCFISTGCNIGAGIRFEKEVFVGIGSTIMTGVAFIGNNSIVGAGSVVIKDVEADVVMAGVPAKVIKRF